VNPIYIRVLFYFLAPILGSIPGIFYDPVMQTLLIDLEIAAIGVTGSAAAAGGVFAIWERKRDGTT
jgi:hypothetical protein